MSDLAQHTRQLMSETTSFLLACLRAGIETATRVLCESRPLDEGERQRIRGAFIAAGLAIDALEAEGKRERLGLVAAIPPEVLGGLEQHAKAFADYGRALEQQRELYVLDFYRRLRDRLTQYFVRGMRPRRHRKLRQSGPSLNDPVFRVRTEPDAQKCYETVARKTGQYEQAREEAKAKAASIAEARAQEAAEKQEAEKPRMQCGGRGKAATEAETKPDAATAPEKPRMQCGGRGKAATEAETKPDAATAPEKPRMQCGGRGKAATNEAATKPDAIWQHPQLSHIANDYSRAFQAWHEKGAQGPPPRPPRKLRRYIQQNAKTNPTFSELLEAANALSQGP